MINASEPTAGGGGVSWRIEQNGTLVLASGRCLACKLSRWTSLSLQFQPPDGRGVHRVTAVVNGDVVGDSVATTATAGMVALITGWHEGEFDNFVAASGAA